MLGKRRDYEIGWGGHIFHLRKDWICVSNKKEKNVFSVEYSVWSQYVHTFRCLTIGRPSGQWVTRSGRGAPWSSDFIFIMRWICWK
jgi:hypothetical protein